MGGTVSKATEKAARKAEFNAKEARWDVEPSKLAVETRLFTWMSYPESESEGEWRTIGAESEKTDLGADAMEFNVVANRDPREDHKTAYRNMATKGIPLRVQVDGGPTRFELMNASGQPEWAWQLRPVAGIEPKLLVGGQPVCATFTAPGRAVYKMVKLSTLQNQDRFFVSTHFRVYRVESVDADVSEVAAVMDFVGHDMKSKLWALPGKIQKGGNLVALYITDTAKKGAGFPRGAAVGVGGDVPLVLALLSAQHGWARLRLREELPKLAFDKELQEYKLTGEDDMMT